MRNKGNTGRSGGRKNNASIRKNDLNKGKPGYNRTPAGENKNRPKKGERSGAPDSGEGRFSKERDNSERPEKRSFSSRPDSRGPRTGSSDSPRGPRTGGGERNEGRSEKRTYGARPDSPRGPRAGGGERSEGRSEGRYNKDKERSGERPEKRTYGARPENPRGPRAAGGERNEGRSEGRYNKDNERSGERPEKRTYGARSDSPRGPRTAGGERSEGNYFKDRKNYKKSESSFDSRGTTEGRFKPKSENEGASETEDGSTTPKPEVRRKYNNERNDKGRYSRHKEFDDKAEVERKMRPKPAPREEEEEEVEEVENSAPARKPFVKGEFSKNKRAEAKGATERFSEASEDDRPARTRTSKPSKSSKEDKRMRLNKFISNAGICSRREADEMIAAGVVSVNGKVITELGYKAYPTDEIRYNGEIIKTERPVYVLLNKPKDFITTTDDPEERRTVMALVENACRERIYPVGRLDRGTTGLLLFTNDGDMTKKLTHPSGRIKKIYHVELDKSLKAGDMKRIAEGLELEDGLTVVDAISYVGDDKKQVGVELHSGKNRIVRRLFESLEYKVVKLDRVYFAGLTKKDLTRGKWRFLTDMELNMLRML